MKERAAPRSRLQSMGEPGASRGPYRLWLQQGWETCPHCPFWTGL